MLTIYFKTDDWHEMDFNDFNVALNDTIQNIHNPVKINTEYSKTISLPLTANNREIIQHYSRLDSLVTNAFDPSNAIPARLEVDGNIVFEGNYAVTKIDLSNNRIEGNFYSVVNTWVNRLKRLTWDDLPTCLPAEFAINKENVYQSWIATPALRSLECIMPGETNYRWTDWIGFAPTLNGEMTDFSCDAMFKSDNTAITYHPWEVFTFNGGDAGLSILKTIIPKPTERQMMQFRSYYQKPYMYVDNLFTLIKNYCNSNDNLPRMEWDPEWANTLNANWRNLIYFLPNLLKTDDKPMSSTIVYNINNPLTFDLSGFQLTRGNTTTTKLSSLFSLVSPDDPDHLIIDNEGWIIGDGRSIDYILPVNAHVDFFFTASNAYNDDGGLHGWNKKMRLNGTINLKVELVDENNTVLAGSTKTVFSVARGNGWNAPTYQTTVNNRPGTGGNYSYEISWSINGSGVYSHAFVATAGSKYKPRYRWEFQNAYDSWTGVDGWATAYVLFTPDVSGVESTFDMPYLEDMIIQGWQYHNLISFTTRSTNTANDIHRLRFASAGRSGRQFTMKDLWSTEENNTPFMVMLKYIKMFNLVITYDNLNDVLRIMPKEKFFTEGFNKGIEDWTDKVDYGKDMSFKPLSWEDKYIEFNYNDADFSKIKSFKDKYGFNYGTKKIGTSYSFNNETKQLLADGDATNASAEMSEYMFNMYQLNRIASSPTATVQLEEAFLVQEAYMINMKDDKMADMNNCFAYRWNTNSNWDRNVNRLANGHYNDYMYITDDCQFENNNGTYNYQPTLSGNITWTTTTEHTTCSEYYCNALRCSIYGTKPQISHYTVITTTLYDPDAGVYMDYNTNYCCLFSVPREDYFNPSVVHRNNQDLWTTRWSNLITEMYSMQNKLLTCYVYLTPEDYNSFKFNKFILIDNVLYLVNKIIDYNPASLEATKCELIQVNDPGAYTTVPTNEVDVNENNDPWRLIPGWFKGGNGRPVGREYEGNKEVSAFYIEVRSGATSTQTIQIKVKKNNANSPTVHIFTSTDFIVWTEVLAATTTSETEIGRISTGGDSNKLYIMLGNGDQWSANGNGHTIDVDRYATLITSTVGVPHNVPDGVTMTGDLG